MEAAQQAEKNLVRILDDAGKGRCFAVLFDVAAYEAPARALFAQLAQKSRAVLCQLEMINDSNWAEVSAALQQAMKERSFKQVSLAAFGATAALAQHITLEQPRFVRSLALIDATTRPHPGMLQRIVDRIERALPLGLPLRSSGRGFDSKAFMQRIRCPSLVVTTALASQYTRSEAQALSGGMPTAWYVDLADDLSGAGLCECVLALQEVPAKCPQKNLNRAGTG